jgi:hypothetical protein
MSGIGTRFLAQPAQPRYVDFDLVVAVLSFRFNSRRNIPVKDVSCIV